MATTGTNQVSSTPSTSTTANATGTGAIQDQFSQNMALQTMLGELNLQLGFTTALANAKEALGQAAKNRAEASKQLV